MSQRPLTVLKFGGSVLVSEDELSVAVHEVFRWVREGHRVVAVVSALGRTTDRLLAEARGYSAEPEPEALGALLATGEARSVALLGLALDRAGIPATVLDPAAVDLRTRGSVLDSEPVSLDAAGILRALESRPVAVLPGFVGRLPDGRTSLLGRGGSDLTAIFVARELGADQCRLVKDVDGLYERDPSVPGPPPRRFRTLGFDDALRLDGRILQHKAVRYARDHGVRFDVGAPSEATGTAVGEVSISLHEAGVYPPAPIRVGLLGLGTVGLGVYRELAARPTIFEVVGAAVRSVKKHADEGVPPGLLTDDPWSIVKADCDVVIEAIGGREPAVELIVGALRRGRDVVTANKTVVGLDGRRLEEIGAVSRARLLYSACVGGGVPVLEAVRRVRAAGPIRSIEGVVNGTTNFVLDRIAEGSTLEDAVRSAQARGFAEADPTADLDGTDAAHKLVILARDGFGVDLDAGAIERTGILGLDPAAVRAAASVGRVYRLVAALRADGRGVAARVGPRLLDAGHPLASVRGEQNRVVIEPGDGEVVSVAGKGAGRWPTTESVLGDLFELVREARTHRVHEAALSA